MACNKDRLLQPPPDEHVLDYQRPLMPMCGLEDADVSEHLLNHLWSMKVSSAVSVAVACLALTGCGSGGDTALLEGIVRITDGCSTVEQGIVGGIYLLFFPDDEVKGSDGRLDYNGEMCGDGDEIALGGRETGVVEGADVPENCGASPRSTAWTVSRRD